MSGPTSSGQLQGTASTDFFSVADPDPGSGAFLTLDPDLGSGIGFFSGSRIPTRYFLELCDKFLGKKFYNSLKTGPNFFLKHLKFFL